MSSYLSGLDSASSASQPGSTAAGSAADSAQETIESLLDRLTNAPDRLPKVNNNFQLTHDELFRIPGMYTIRPGGEQHEYYPTALGQGWISILNEYKQYTFWYTDSGRTDSGRTDRVLCPHAGCVMTVSLDQFKTFETHLMTHGGSWVQARW